MDEATFYLRHLSRKSKKYQIFKERHSEIDKTNRILIEKLTKIHDGIIKSKYNYKNTMILKNPQQIDRKLKDGKTFYYDPKHKRDSNTEQHYKSTLPNISKLKLEEVITDKHIQKPQSKFTNTILLNKTKSKDVRYKHGRPNVSQTLNDTNVCTIPESPRELLIKRSKKFGRELFNIELFKIKNQLEIYAINTQLSKKFSILINPKKFIEISRAFQQNYDLLLDKLAIVRNRLMIVAPTQKEVKEYNMQKKSEGSLTNTLNKDILIGNKEAKETKETKETRKNNAQPELMDLAEPPSLKNS